MIMDARISDDLKKWKKLLNLTKKEVRLIKKDIKGMKMKEFMDLVNMVTRNSKGEVMKLWFNLYSFTPVTLSIYHLKIKSLRFMLEEVWETAYSNRTRTTDIIELLPIQKTKYAKKYNFIHEEKQGKKCPNTKYWNKKNSKKHNLIKEV